MTERFDSQEEREMPVAERMLRNEADRLRGAAKGPAGKWLARLGLLLSTEGCVSLNEYRRAVQTTISVQPTIDPRSGFSGAMLNAAFVPRTREGRLDLVRREHDRALLNAGDELVEARDGRDYLEVSALPGHWWRDMHPGIRYQGSDGHRYVLLAFSEVESRPSGQPVGRAIGLRLHRPRRPGEIVGQPSTSPLDITPVYHLFPERAETTDPGLSGAAEVSRGALGLEGEILNRFVFDPPAERGTQEHDYSSNPNMARFLRRFNRQSVRGSSAAEDTRIPLDHRDKPIVFYLARSREPVTEE